MQGIVGQAGAGCMHFKMTEKEVGTALLSPSLIFSPFFLLLCVRLSPALLVSFQPRFLVFL